MGGGHATQLAFRLIAVLPTKRLAPSAGPGLTFRAMPETLPAASLPPSPNPSAPMPALLDLFVAFAVISLCGFGGVLAWSRRMLVEERKWMTAEEFNDAYALCQFLPGPNVVNLSVVFGRRIRGLPGAVVALVGL